MITKTYKLIMAAAQDAGNRNMRAEGRTEWNEQDWNVSAAAFERLSQPNDSMFYANL